MELAQDYKRTLSNRARDIIAYGLNLEKYNAAKNEACCPFHKEKTPSFKWNDKEYFWKCFGCGEVMDVYKYLQEFKGMSFTDAVKEVAEMVGASTPQLNTNNKPKQYKKPNVDMHELSPEAIKYMESRKISEQTLKDLRVKQRTWNGKQCYVFQYFDDKGELQHVTYREIGKGGMKGGCEKDTKSILWNMWQIDKDKPVIITEGQPDLMAIWEAGYKNVVSVPSGSNNMTWIDNCWEWLQEIQEFIIFGDMDEPGVKMTNELQTRLGKYRTKIIQHHRKDPNEILYFDGKDEVLRLINEAINQAPAGIIDMSKYKYSDSTSTEGIATGIHGLDSTIEDLQPEQLSVLVGRNSEGKSTLVSQIICHCIDNKVPTFLYSGELSPKKILNWIYRQAIGSEKQYLKFEQGKYRVKAHIKSDTLKALKEWTRGLFYTFDKTTNDIRKNADSLFQAMEIAVKRYGCKLLIIDNLMSALEEVADEHYANQSNFIQRCKDFAEGYKCHVMIVCHPNKVKRQGERLEKEDISGSNNIPNKADLIFSIERQYKENKECDTKLRLLKDREEGRYCEIKLMFQEDSKRLIELSDGKLRHIEYGWKQYLSEEYAKLGFYEIDKPTDCPF